MAGAMAKPANTFTALLSDTDDAADERLARPVCGGVPRLSMGLAGAQVAGAAVLPASPPRSPRRKPRKKPKKIAAECPDALPVENPKQVSEGVKRRRAKRKLNLRLKKAAEEEAERQAEQLSAQQSARHSEAAPARSCQEAAPGEQPTVPEQQPDEIVHGQELSETLAEESTQRIRPEDLQAGDIVLLGAGVPPEFRHCNAVILKVAETHCTVNVLDESCRFGVGELWPNFEDIELDPTCGSWRLGKRVMMDGLTGSKTKHLNGSRGVICAHPSQGHPTFIRKPSSPDRPQFTLCIRLDNPPPGEKSTVLMEPRFLVPYDKFVKRLTMDIGQTIALLNKDGGLKADEAGGAAFKDLGA